MRESVWNHTITLPLWACCAFLLLALLWQWLMERQTKNLRGLFETFRDRDELERAQQALDNTGIAGIMDEFYDLPDAIEQMALRIRQLEDAPPAPTPQEKNADA